MLTREEADSIKGMILESPVSFNKGNRNNSCVDLCIACSILAAGDPTETARLIRNCAHTLTEISDGFDDKDYTSRTNKIFPYLKEGYNTGEPEQFMLNTYSY